MQKPTLYLPDVNVWLAIAADGHIHHRAATAWFETAGPEQAAFCRVTQMGFLRLLTDSRAMHEDVLGQNEAWRVYDKLREDERVTFLADGDDVEREWRAFTQHRGPTLRSWTDCYLQATAAARQAVLVTFDRTLVRSRGRRPLV